MGALASYVANYYTESVGQWVANDLRMRTYHHLERLSLGYFDTHQTGMSVVIVLRREPPRILDSVSTRESTKRKSRRSRWL